MTPRAPVLFWDVLEEHLDEAEFLWAQWERGLVAHDLTLDELASGAERRLLAHIDGLIIAGPPAAERLLLPAIAGADPERASAAASALLAGPVAGLDAVADALTRAPVERRAPLLRALALAERPEIDLRLTGWIGSDDPALRAAALSTLTFRGGEPGRALGKIRGDDAPELVRAGVIAARSARSRALQQLAGEALSSTTPALRDEAIITGLILGFSSAWEACRRLVTSSDPSARGLLSLAAIVGGPDDRRAVERALDVPELTRPALEALGHAGTKSGAESCLARVAHPELGASASLAFFTITGIPLRAPWALPASPAAPEPPDDDALDAAARDASLPRLDPDAALAWWEDNRARFDPESRYLFGEPLRIDTALAALRRGPMSRRASLALELAIRSRGRASLETRAFSARQRAELVRLRSLPSLDFARPLE